jgi:uncharacterized protein
MYMVGTVAGIKAQNRLWSYLTRGLVTLHLSGNDEWRQMHVLMNQYADLPLDLADASLITAAERIADRKLFTIDQHLRAVRLGKNYAFDIVP